jgi:glutamate-1-semialdehyde aminotransferase/spore coat polysaccharide biosynthesis protein SpsF (cytidylyltransferase family)
VVAIVQARLGSSRLPGKVLADIGGRPLLQLLLERVGNAATLDEVVLAIPDDPSDDALAAAAARWGHLVVRGSGTDVLARYAVAAQATAADVIVRLTGDNPLADTAVIDAVVTHLLSDPNLDYVGTGITFPEGADCEAFHRHVLDIAAAEATKPSHREHVSLFVRDQPDRFALDYLVNDTDLGHVRLTVDEPADLDVVNSLVGRYGMSASIVTYALALADDLALRARNQSIVRNEGLWRSRHEDDLAQVREGLIHGREQSDAWLARATDVIPGATQTMSKAVDQFVAGVTPTFLVRGSGAHVWDVDGNAYIDYPMALGPIILGYGHPGVTEAVTRQLADGTTFSLPHPIEVEVAERMADMVPCAEMTRFAKNGSDATSAAVRLARAVTGRERVLVTGYHGWHDWYCAITARDRGVPSALKGLIEMVPFNDVAALHAAFERAEAEGSPVAAVVTEIGIDDPKPGWFEAIRQACDRHGALFVWDEIVTGFRWAPGGAQQRYGVTPDLAAFGKAMANGFPLAAVSGRAELMREFGSVFFSGTFGGETLSLAAAKVTMDEIARGLVLDHVWSMGRRLRDGIASLIVDTGVTVELAGQVPRGALLFRDADGNDSPALKGLFFQETVRRGVLFGGPMFTTWAHSPADIDHTLEVVAEAFVIMREATESDSVEQRLDGPPPGVVFKPIRS